MISQLFILSSQGDHLIYKDFRGEMEKASMSTFYEMVSSLSGDQPPVVMSHKGVNFIHIRHAGLYWVVSTKTDPSPFTVVDFLNRLVALIKDYCGSVCEKTVPHELRSDLRAPGRDGGLRLHPDHLHGHPEEFYSDGAGRLQTLQSV
ncbi:hypothetical protein Q7C36_019622 [Tachysurus vachellii]|uniref:AP complex mu/sigma subunit domain-containing protein n=1 Tax=Tachysurus vachellii TaxID=175792 RepID=A0AA88RY51_TACVA|nr:hypothetical protein Q7C36_019622 [Tachysurus vachellii]